MNVLVVDQGRRCSSIDRIIARTNWTVTNSPPDWRSEIAATHAEAVMVWSSLAARADITRHALHNGKHVLVRRPLSMEPQVCRELESLAAQKNLCLRLDYSWLTAPLPEKGSWAKAKLIRFKRGTERVEVEKLAPESYAAEQVAVLHHLVGHLRYFWECYFGFMVGVTIGGPRVQIDVFRDDSPCTIQATWMDGRKTNVRLPQSSRLFHKVLEAFANDARNGCAEDHLSSQVAMALQVVEKNACNMRLCE